MIGICACIGCACTPLSIVGVVILLRPLTQLCAQLERIADMDIEFMQLEATSRIAEIRKIQLCMAVVVTALKEYKNYMPSSLFVATADDEVEEEKIEIASDESRKGNPRRSSLIICRSARSCPLGVPLGPKSPPLPQAP